jgi:hypothetical protein
MLWIFLLIAAFSLGKRAVLSTGEAAAFTVGPYTVVISRDDTAFSWRVWMTDVFESADDAAGLDLAGGMEDTQRKARQAAAQWIASQQAPAPVASVGQAATERAGLRMSGACDSVTVADLDAWIAYALPRIRAYDVEEPQAEEVMRLTLGGAFPACAEPEAKPKIRGASWSSTARRVQRLIEKIRAGKLISVEEPEVAVAARIVGMSAPRIDGAAAYVVAGWQGAPYAIVLTPEGDRWRYRVWAGPRASNRDASATGLTDTNAAAAAAANDEAQRAK